MSKSLLGRAPNGRFLSGNQAALKSGAHSLAVVRERSEEVRAELADHIAKYSPHLGAADVPLTDMLVDVLTRLKLTTEYLDRASGGSLVDRRGVVKPASAVYFEAVRLARNLMMDLGIGPKARAQILDEMGIAQERRAIAVRAAQDRIRASLDAPKELPSADE